MTLPIIIVTTSSRDIHGEIGEGRLTVRNTRVRFVFPLWFHSVAFVGSTLSTRIAYPERLWAYSCTSHVPSAWLRMSLPCIWQLGSCDLLQLFVRKAALSSTSIPSIPSSFQWPLTDASHTTDKPIFSQISQTTIPRTHLILRTASMPSHENHTTLTRSITY
jgi:hypothetical protein